jgi:hypothetical protein
MPSVVAGQVVGVGGPAPLHGSNDRPWPDSHANVVIVGTTATGERLVRRLYADAQGRFALKLPAGVYTVSAQAHSGLPLAKQPHTKLTVAHGDPARVRVTILAT